MRTAIALALLLAGIAPGRADASSGVRVRFSNEMTGFYIEGYFWFASLDRVRPKHVAATSVLLPTRPGRHVLHVFIRPCDGNCSSLDPPTKRCSAPVRSGQTATYHLRDSGCTITVRG